MKNGISFIAAALAALVLLPACGGNKNTEVSAQSFDDIVASRRSVRDYEAGTTISEAQVRTLIATAMEAPTWANTQTTRYYVAMSEALSELRDGLCDRIIFITPTTEAGSAATRIGLLPGTAEEKIAPYVENMRDTITKILRSGGNYNPEEVSKNLLKDERVAIKLMNYARGTTYDNAVVIIDEGENFSKSEMLLLLTRIGENTRYFILGSEKQCDRKDIKAEGASGMMYAYERLSELEEVGSIEFTDDDVVRNPIIGKILKLWD